MLIGEYEAKLEGKHCIVCNAPLDAFLSRTFTKDDDGITVDDFLQKVVLICHCKECGHDNTLSELGIIKPDGKQVRLVNSEQIELILDATIDKKQ